MRFFATPDTVKAFNCVQRRKGNSLDFTFQDNCLFRPGRPEGFEGQMTSAVWRTIMKYLVAVLLLAGSCVAQRTGNLPPRTGFNVGVGYLATTGSPGISGVTVPFGLKLGNLELAGEFDAAATNIRLPDITVKVRQQEYLFGPRYYFVGTLANPRFVPFAHLLFGVSHQSTDTTASLVPGGSSSDNAWAWQLGGGIDYRFNTNWAGRGRADIFRTHFLDESQTHARYGLGVVYSFGR